MKAESRQSEARCGVEAEAGRIHYQHEEYSICRLHLHHLRPPKIAFWVCLCDKRRSEYMDTQAQLDAITSTRIALLRLIGIQVQLEPGNEHEILQCKITMTVLAPRPPLCEDKISLIVLHWWVHMTKPNELRDKGTSLFKNRI